MVHGDKFIWDEEKFKSNILKHGVSFIEATTVFEDENAIYGYDEEHSEDEDRFVVIGLSSEMKMLMVCHCYRNCDEVVRIISARKANSKEKAQYRRA